MFVDKDTIVNDVKVTIDEIGLNDSEFEADPEFETEQDNSEMTTIIESKIADALHFIYANADASLLEADTEITIGNIGAEITGKGVGKCLLPANFLRLVYAKFSSWVRAVGGDEVISWVDKQYAMLKDKYTTGTPERPKVAMVQNGTNKALELYSAGVGDVVAIFPGDSNCTLREGIYQKQLMEKVYQGEGWYVATVNDEEDPATPKTCVIRLIDGKYTLTLVDKVDLNELAQQDTFVVGIMTEPAMIEEGGKSGFSVPDKCYRAAVYYIAGLTLLTYREADVAQLMFQQASDLIGYAQKPKPVVVQQPIEEDEV